MTAKLWVCCAALLAALLAAPAARADAPSNITRGEVALLPEYCQDTLTFATSGGESGPNERQARWVGMMGRAFWAMHHYCWALLAEHRSGQAGVSAYTRDHLLKTAIDDCYFVIKHAQPGFVMLPEIYTRMGDFSVKRGRLDEAHAFFDNAREVKPDYWPPYERQARIFMRLNQPQSALQVVDKGLSHVPDQPQLLELRRQIGGAKRPAPAKPAASAVPP